MARLEEDIVTHVAITWGDDYPLLATQLPRGEALTLGGEGRALALCTPGPWTLLDVEGRLWVPRGAALQWSRRASDEAVTHVPALDAQGVEGAWVPLREGDRVRLRHGGMCFYLEVAAREPHTWSGVVRWDRAALFALAGSACLHGLFLLLGLLLPPTASALSRDLHGEDLARARYLLEAAATATPPPEPSWLDGPSEGGEEGASAAGEQGEAGEPDATPSDRRMVVPRGPASRKARNIEAGDVRELRTFAVLDGVATSLGEALFDPNAAADAERQMGKLFGSQVGANQGFGALGLRGVGRGGGGEALGTYGTGDFETRGGAGAGPGGAVAGGLGRRGGRAGATPPTLRTKVELAGSLSKEAIRRTIRRHTNEVRHCYEQGLRTRPDLAGRVRVLFLIQPDGSVGRAQLHSSSVGASQVERCIVQAVRRWGFPRPRDGGVVSVTYPFLLQSSP